MSDPDERMTTDDWCTPQWLAEALGTFDVDPCSNGRSHVSARSRWTIIDDGLVMPWVGSVFCNPPYSDPLPWARRLAAHDGAWVALVKLDTTTRWWATLMEAGSQWAAFRGRLKFEQPGKMQTANFASVLVWHRWHPSRELAAKLWLPTYATGAV